MNLGIHCSHDTISACYDRFLTYGVAMIDKDEEFLTIYNKYQDFVANVSYSVLRDKFNSDTKLYYMSIANYGLYKAFKDYDDSKGMSFEGYAKIRIRSELLDYERREAILSRRYFEKYKKYLDVKDKLYQEKEGKFSYTDIVNRLKDNGINIDDVPIIEFIDINDIEEKESDDTDLFADVLSTNYNYLLNEALDVLTINERFVITCLYFYDIKLSDIGRMLEISTEGVFSTKKRALSKLKKYFIEKYNINEYEEL